jgi:hypothetical protein
MPFSQKTTCSQNQNVKGNAELNFKKKLIGCQVTPKFFLYQMNFSGFKFCCSHQIDHTVSLDTRNIYKQPFRRVEAFVLMAFGDELNGPGSLPWTAITIEGANIK